MTGEQKDKLRDALKLVQAAQVLLRQAQGIYQQACDDLAISNTQAKLVYSARSDLGHAEWFTERELED